MINCRVPIVFVLVAFKDRVLGSEKSSGGISMAFKDLNFSLNSDSKWGLFPTYRVNSEIGLVLK